MAGKVKSAVIPIADRVHRYNKRQDENGAPHSRHLVPNKCRCAVPGLPLMSVTLRPA